MPMPTLCRNYNDCKGVAASGSKYCECCLEAQRRAQQEQRIKDEYKALTTKPRRPSEVMR